MSDELFKCKFCLLVAGSKQTVLEHITLAHEDRLIEQLYCFDKKEEKQNE